MEYLAFNKFLTSINLAELRDKYKSIKVVM